ncbi:MAG TPA: hypothetical protein VFT56_10080 [Sphingomonas sp.]|nr:hypothetical protein [Sphingomonas sp.]
MARQRSAGSRAGLIALARRYLAALAAGTPADIALAPDYRATENGQMADPGEGLWRSARAFPGHPAILCDEMVGEVVIFGAAEFEELRPFALRLHIEADMISEAEAIISSSAHGFFADVDKLVDADVLYEAPVPSDRGGTRETLRCAADSYWVGLAESDGSMVEVNHRADRFANGKKVTNNLEILLSPDKAVHTIASLLTATRPARPQVREKRFPILDTVRGVSASIAIVDFADDPQNPRPDAGSFYIMNAMKVVDGQIRIIDAIHQILPRGAVSAWSGTNGSNDSG